MRTFRRHGKKLMWGARGGRRVEVEVAMDLRGRGVGKSSRGPGNR